MLRVWLRAAKSFTVLIAKQGLFHTLFSWLNSNLANWRAHLNSSCVFDWRRWQSSRAPVRRVCPVGLAQPSHYVNYFGLSGWKVLNVHESFITLLRACQFCLSWRHARPVLTFPKQVSMCTEPICQRCCAALLFLNLPCCRAEEGGRKQ